MLAAAYLQYASLDPRVPIRRMGGAALHLDRFEQPAEKLKTAHLRGPILRMGTPKAEALVAAYREYAWTQPTTGYPALRLASF